MLYAVATAVMQRMFAVLGWRLRMCPFRDPHCNVCARTSHLKMAAIPIVPPFELCAGLVADNHDDIQMFSTGRQGRHFNPDAIRA